MNNKGFTLVEALAVIVVLSLVLSIGGYSVASYLSDSKEKGLNVFKNNVKSGMINYYNECKYLSTGVCSPGDIQEVKDENDNDTVIGYKLSTTIGTLAEFGFIENQGNDEETGSLIINNPINEEEDLTKCQVSIIYYTDKHGVEKEKQTFSDVTYDKKTCGSLGN